ncbi:MAG: hypothetical protein CL949_00515 [Erythrobacter sp.]|nr:hypothetical protein [Erythrobacter sp.]
MRMIAVLVLVASFTVACAAAAGGAAPRARTNKETTAASIRGLVLAKARCAICHAVEIGISSKPEAPPFEEIVNTPGLTPDTLKPWLRDSHNYPEIMNFEIAPEQIDDLAAFMMTLKDPAFRPPIQ